MSSGEKRSGETLESSPKKLRSDNDPRSPSRSGSTVSTPLSLHSATVPRHGAIQRLERKLKNKEFKEMMDQAILRVQRGLLGPSYNPPAAAAAASTTAVASANSGVSMARQLWQTGANPEGSTLATITGSQSTAVVTCELGTDRSLLGRWDKREFYMQLALSAALRSSDFKTQVGCVIVDQFGAVIGVGYNGMPYGVENDPDHSNWSDDKKALRVVHAETNALMHVANHERLQGSTVFVTLFPCARCAGLLIQARVKNIVYYSYRKEIAKCKSKPSQVSSAAAAASSFIEAKCATNSSCQRCNGREDTYEVSAAMLKEAKINVHPYFENRKQAYDSASNERMKVLVYAFTQQVFLLSSLKERESKDGFQTAEGGWPEFEFPTVDADN